MPELSPAQARDRFAAARVARLATIGSDGAPHLVPLVFAVVDDLVVSAVDQKPKRSAQLRRLDNLRSDPRCCLLVDHYDEDWSALWWVRADGRGRVLADDDPVRSLGLAHLLTRYDADDQYGRTPPAGPVIAVQVLRWTGWAAVSPDRPDGGPTR